MTVKTIVTLSLALSFSPLTFAAESAQCMTCHDRSDFSGMTAGDIVTAVKDAKIPPHKRFAGVSDEELQAIAAELAAGE